MFLPFSYIPYVLGGVLMKFLCYLSKKKKKKFNRLTSFAETHFYFMQEKINK